MVFPNRLNHDWPVGHPGQWASENPRRIVLSGPGGYRAGENGLAIAAFAWVQEDGTTLLNHPPETAPEMPSTGFVYRDQQGLAIHYLNESNMTIPPGFMVTLAEGGDVFARSTTDSRRGDAVFASVRDGHIETAPIGHPPERTVRTGWVVSIGGPTGMPIIMTGPLSPPG